MDDVLVGGEELKRGGLPVNRREFVARSLTAAGSFALATRYGAALESEGRRPAYRVGEKVSPDVFFLDARGERQTLAGQVNEYTKVLYLFVFGGAFRKRPEGKRGELWCGDSMDDLSIQRSIYLNYASRGVTFVPVATPPVYDGPRYGYPDEVFLREPADSPLYRESVEVFIQKTETLKDDGTIPYDPVFYDPRFRLLDNPYVHEHVKGYGDVAPWQGRFKAEGDHQRYGTPTLWLLSPELEVLREPFFGNAYESVPLAIRYTVRDLAQALDRALAP